MNIFKAALRVAARHRVYFIIYLVALSLCGLPILFADTGGGSGTHETFDASVAVVDRDASAVSAGLVAHMDGACELVSLSDDTRAIQDALARSEVDAVIVVPQGFGRQLVKAARENKKVPKVQVAYGTNVQSGALCMSEATGWLSLVGRAAALDGASNQRDIVKRANEVQGKKAKVAVTDVEAAEGGVGLFTSYVGFNTYSLFVTTVVCVGLVMTRFRDERVRRRCEASPQRPGRMNRSVVAAGLVLVLIAWAWVALLSLLFGNDALKNAAPGQVAVCLAAMFMYCLTPLALAFTLSQLNASEQSLNAVGNIFGLVSAFFSGAWISLELVGANIRSLAMFTPGYWFVDVLNCAFSARSLASISGRLGTDFGMMLLFAVVTALIGVAASRVHVRRSVGVAAGAGSAK